MMKGSNKFEIDMRVKIVVQLIKNLKPLGIGIT